MNKVTDLILDNFNGNRYIYHYSERKFDSIKNREMLGLNAPVKTNNPSEYIKTASFLLEPIPLDIIKRYKEEGFTAWNSDSLYEYKIDILENKKRFDGSIKLTSTPEQLKYDKQHWEKTFRKNNIDLTRIKNDNHYWEINKEIFLKIKTKYFEDRTKFLNKIYGYLTPSSYAVSEKIKDLREENIKWLEYNLIHGDKEQYASYIPHIHTPIKKPLRPLTINKIL